MDKQEFETIVKQLYEDGGGGLHLVTFTDYADRDDLTPATVYHIGDRTAATLTSTYAEDASDLSWLSDFEADSPEYVEPAEAWLDASLYATNGMRKNDGGLTLIAETNNVGKVKLRGTAGNSGSVYLGFQDEGDE